MAGPEKEQQYRYPLVEEPREDLICPLCLDLLASPMLTRCCGHHFCRQCLDKLEAARARATVLESEEGSSQLACPMCKCKREDGFTTVLDKKTDRVLRALKVNCPNREAGCLWQGEAGGMDEHLLKRCERTRRECTRGCGALLLSSELDEHLLSTCTKRDCVCQHCGVILVFEALEGHWRACPDAPVSCPNACGVERLLRRQMDGHLGECPMQAVSCRFATAGCSQSPPRKDVARHMEACMQAHLTMLLDAFTSLHEQAAEKDCRLAALEQQLRERDQEVKEVRQHLYKLQYEVAQRAQQQATDVNAKLRGAIGHVSLQLQQHQSGTLEDTRLLKRSVRTLEMLVPMPPYHFTLTNYTLKKQGKKVWMCAPFFTHLEGYKMAVEVSVNGENTGKNSHVSLYVRVMRGEYDDLLAWPLTAKVTIQLISQLDRMQDYELTTPAYTWERVMDGTTGSGWGWDKFIAHDQLERKPSYFLKNDRLNFTVICVDQ